MQNKLIKIDKDFLREIHDGNPHTPTIYFHDNYFVRNLFWDRLNQAAKFIAAHKGGKRNVCLDFGGGAGHFLPTVSKMFDKVILIDQEAKQAVIIKDKFSLDNCKIIEQDLYEYSYTGADCLVALDVLEHFKDTEKILTKLKSLMDKDTLFVTSMPTESGLYEFLRIVFKQEKPADHYHNAKDIETKMKKMGFKRIRHKSIPLPFPFALFSISAWQLDQSK